MKSSSPAIFTILLWFIGFSPVYAIGISATPATLSIKTVSNKEGITRFIISNPSKEVGLFEAYPEEFEESIALFPSTFVLEAGEKREILVRARRREAGIIRTAIAIEAERLGIPSLGVGGGVRLPFSLEVKAAQNSLAAVLNVGSAPAIITFVLTVLVLLGAVSLYTLKRSARRDTL